MGRAKGFRLQAGFGVHLHRGCLATSRGCLATRSGGVWPHAAGVSGHKSYTLKYLRRLARPQVVQPQPFLRELQLSHLDNHLYSLSYGPTCAPVPHQGLRPLSDLCPNPAPGCAPAPRQSVHPLSDLCPQFPTETPVPRLAPPPSSHPHPRSFPSSDSFRLCPCPHPRRGRPRPRTHNSRACAKRSSTGSTRTNASYPCAHQGTRPGERWLAKS